MFRTGGEKSVGPERVAGGIFMKCVCMGELGVSRVYGIRFSKLGDSSSIMRSLGRRNVVESLALFLRQRQNY